MSPEHPAPASHRAMTISVIVAAVALTVFALVGTALMLGWIHPMAGGLTPASFASPAQQLGGTQGAEPRSPHEAHGGPCRGPSARLWRLRGRHSQGTVRRRHGDRLGSRNVGSGG